MSLKDTIYHRLETRHGLRLVELLELFPQVEELVEVAGQGDVLLAALVVDALAQVGLTVGQQAEGAAAVLGVDALGAEKPVKLWGKEKEMSDTRLQRLKSLVYV